MNPNDLFIDPELAGLLMPHTEAELGHLEDALRTDGLLTPLLVWPHENRLVLLDGFARLKIADRLGIPIRWTEVSLPDADAAVEFRLKQQLSRRNVPAVAQAYLRGKLYILAGRCQGKRTNRPGQKPDARLTAKEVAERFGVSERTIRREQRLSEAVDLLGRLENLGPEFKALLLSGCSRLPRREVFRLLHQKQVERERRLAQLRAEADVRRARPRRKPPAPKVATTDRNSGADTPTAVREDVAPRGFDTATQMPAPTPQYDSLPPDTKHTYTAACRLANPTPPAPPVDTEPADEGVLKKLTAVWRKANHETKILFLRQPSVQIAVQRLHSSEVRK